MAGVHHHPLWTRVLHSCNAIILLVMAGSGLQIYNANPVFGGRAGTPMPALLTLGGWLAGGRWWHFGFMGLFAFILGSWLLLLLQMRRQRLTQNADLSTLSGSNNPGKRKLALHRLTYSLLLIVLAMALLSGLAMYKPASLWWLTNRFGSWQQLRLIHFSTVPAIALLASMHVVLSIRVGGWRLLRTISW